ncbi:MAG: hypothetical protein ACHQT7_00690 [Candidatus Levyibacteriota bacterium]
MVQKAHLLPPIKTLLKDSWKTFKGSVLNLFILHLVGFAVILGVGILGVLLSLPLGLLAIISGAQAGKLTPAIISSIGTLGILVLIIILVFIVIGHAIHAANTLFVGKYQSKPAFGKTLKKSLGYVLPLILLGIVSFFMVTGGYFLLIIPGIFFAILFSFAPYEIILNNQGVLSSLRRSMSIVLAHFWGVVTRLLLWVIIVIAFAFLPAVLGGRGAGMSGLSFIINTCLGWFGVCYHIALYKQATKNFDPKKGDKLLWPVIAGVIGWVVGIIMITALSSAIFLAVMGAIQKGKAKPKALPPYQVQQVPNTAPLQGSSSAY